MTPIEFIVQVVLLSAIAVAVTYMTAIRYTFSWGAMLLVVITLSVINGALTSYISNKIPANERRSSSIIQDTTGALIVAVITAFASFGILATRFGVGSAFVLFVIGGFGSSFMNYLLRTF